MTDKKKKSEDAPSPLEGEGPGVRGENETFASETITPAPSGREEADALGNGEIPQVEPHPVPLTPDPSPSQAGRGEEPHPPPLSSVEGGEDDSDGDVVEDVVARDIRTDPFLVLVVRANGATGFRLGTMAPRDIVSVSGDLTEDTDGLIAWFNSLPGEVRFRDGTRVVVRYNEADELVAEVL